MSYKMVTRVYPPFPYNLGQTEPDIAPLPPAPVPESIAAFWDRLRIWCEQNAPAGICDKLLPSPPIWIAPREEGFGSPWWGWLGIGFLGAKILRF